MTKLLADLPTSAPRLDTVVVGTQWRVFDELDSTNAYALACGTDGMVVVADCQTAGRGRHGRGWHSARGLGLWFSVAFEGRPIEGLGFGAALAVRDALAADCPLDVKWPNDLLAKGRKVCGILVEHRHGQTALGVGINVHHRLVDFPEALRDTAGSLEIATGVPWDRGEVLCAVLNQLDRQVMLLRSGRLDVVHRSWIEACGLVGRRVRVGSTVGVVRDIDRQGALVLDTSRGVRRVVSGEMAPAPAARDLGRPAL